jgi:hypothetical protein
MEVAAVNKAIGAESACIALLLLVTLDQLRCCCCCCAGPSMEVAAINKAIGAESAFSLQCKSMVQQYVPQIIKMITQMPLDQVGSCQFLVTLLLFSGGCVGCATTQELVCSASRWCSRTCLRSSR